MLETRDPIILLFVVDVDSIGRFKTPEHYLTKLFYYRSGKRIKPHMFDFLPPTAESKEYQFAYNSIGAMANNNDFFVHITDRSQGLITTSSNIPGRATTARFVRLLRVAPEYLTLINGISKEALKEDEIDEAEDTQRSGEPTSQNN